MQVLVHGSDDSRHDACGKRNGHYGDNWTDGRRCFDIGIGLVTGLDAHRFRYNKAHRVK